MVRVASKAYTPFLWLFSVILSSLCPFITDNIALFLRKRGDRDDVRVNNIAFNISKTVFSQTVCVCVCVLVIFFLIYVTAKSKMATLHMGVWEAKVKLSSFSLPLHVIEVVTSRPGNILGES